jgi:PAS domain-containing protein
VTAQAEAPERNEPGILYLEASADGHIEKVFGDRSWLPYDLRAESATLGAILPALEGAQSIPSLELDFVEIEPDLFVDIQYQSDGGRQFVWLRNTSRHAAHLRAAQQHANATALREAISSRWKDDIHRENSHIRMLFDAVPVPIGYWSTAGTLIYCNAPFALACERPAAALLGQSASSPTLGCMQLPDSTILNGTLRGRHTEVRRKGVWQHSHIIEDLSPAGEIVGFLDVTADKSQFQ